MADLWVVLTVFAFFGLCVLLIRGCDRIIGSDDTAGPGDESEPEPVEASR